MFLCRFLKGILMPDLWIREYVEKFKRVKYNDMRDAPSHTTAAMNTTCHL